MEEEISMQISLTNMRMMSKTNQLLMISTDLKHLNVFKPYHPGWPRIWFEKTKTSCLTAKWLAARQNS